MTKSQKEYNDVEHVTHEVRLKAHEAEGKFKNKSTSIFTSLATLQKNNAKVSYICILMWQNTKIPTDNYINSVLLPRYEILWTENIAMKFRIKNIFLECTILKIQNVFLIYYSLFNK